MSVTGKQLYNKFHELRPDLTSGITPEILSKVADNLNTQPFLQWFCKNISRANILTNDEIKTKSALQTANEWLEGDALDAALAEATKNSPELLELIDADDRCRKDLFAEYEALKEGCRDDEDYIQILRHSIKNLKGIEDNLDDDIEEAGIKLDREQIEMEKMYDNCSAILKEFDKDNCQFSKDVDNLLNVYADAAKNQSSAVLWSHMPLDTFIKQIELYNHYLNIHIKGQFGNGSTEKEQERDSDYSSLIIDNKKQADKRMRELSLCKTNLTNSKIEEISCIIQEKAYTVMLQCAQEIYNGGDLKIPGNNKLHDEILTLSTKRDFLEQNIECLREQQYPEAAQYAEMEMIKILKNDALARLERRKIRLEKLKDLYSLAGEHGHVYVDLLCMLMEMQYCCLREATEFIRDARHYITTEYKLSSTRCEIMQQQQDEYTTLLTQSPETYNAFKQILISMILGNNIAGELFPSALKKYNDLIAENSEKKKSMFETYLNSKICKLQDLENELNKDYIAETQNGPTISLSPISYEIGACYEEVAANVQEMQTDVTKIRNKLKERMRFDINLEREKNILWQRFLADTDTLRIRYEEAERRANESHFGDNLGSKVP